MSPIFRNVAGESVNYFGVPWGGFFHHQSVHQFHHMVWAHVCVRACVCVLYMATDPIGAFSDNDTLASLASCWPNPSGMCSSLSSVLYSFFFFFPHRHELIRTLTWAHTHKHIHRNWHGTDGHSLLVEWIWCLEMCTVCAGVVAIYVNVLCACLWDSVKCRCVQKKKVTVDAHCQYVWFWEWVQKVIRVGGKWALTSLWKVRFMESICKYWLFNIWPKWNNHDPVFNHFYHRLEKECT